MSIKVGLIIKDLRAKNGITQDQLATFIGVTPQAISRWESQNGYPDIELLPMIADFFCVSVDELLGRKLDEREKRRSEIYKKIDEYRELGLANEEILSEARIFAAEFPSDEKIQENLAQAICCTYMWEEEPDIDKFSEAERIYKALLSTTKNNDFRNKILCELSVLYANGFKDKNKLEETINQLPIMLWDREFVGAKAFWHFDGSIVRIQDYIKKLTDGLGIELRNYTVDCIDNSPEMWDTKIAMFEKIIELYKFVFGENMLFYHIRVADLYRFIATYKVAQEKYGETLDCLEKMLYHIKREQEAKRGDKYESLFVNQLEAYVDLPNLGESNWDKVHNQAWYNLTAKLPQERYDPIRETPRFVKIVEELTKIAK